MAVTLYIVSVREDKLAKCATSERQLYKLLSSRLEEDEVDMDWSAEALLESAVESKQHADVITALTMAFQGKRLVNESHPDGARKYFVYSNITMLNTTEVQFVDKALRLLNWDSLKETLKPKHLDNLGLYRFHLSKMEELIKLMEESANEKWAVAQWWD